MARLKNKRKERESLAKPKKIKNMKMKNFFGDLMKRKMTSRLIFIISIVSREISLMRREKSLSINLLSHA